MYDGRSSRRRRVSAAVDRLAPIEEAACAEVARRDIARAIDRVRPGWVDVPDVAPEVEAVAAAARARRPPTPPAEVDRMRARVAGMLDELHARQGP